jgi:HK97 family phage portal protein
VSLLRRAFGGQESRSIEFGSSAIPLNSQLADLVGTGVVVSPDGVLRVATGMSCVQAVAEDLAMLPMFAYRDLSEDDSTRKMTPQPRIVIAPFGDDVSPQTGISQILVSLLLRGNAFCRVVERDYLGHPTSLVVLNPDRVQVFRDENGRKRFRVNSQLVANEDVRHIVGLSTPGADVGISVVEYQRSTIGLALAVDQFGATWFGKGVHPSGMISVEGALSEDKARAMQERIMSRHAGMNRAHGIMVLSGGAKFTPLSISPEDAQFLATKELLREDICGVFGVPPDRVSVGGVKNRTPANGKGLETIGQQYVTHTLLRWARRIEHCWTQMIPTGKTRVKFDFGELLRADSNTRWSNHLIGRTIGAINNNDVRRVEDLPPISGSTGEAYDFPLNSAHATAGDAGPAGGVARPPDAKEVSP